MVGLQHVSRPLPDVAQLMQLPAQGPLRPTAAVPPGQVLLEQPDGPLQVTISPMPRRLLQCRAQDGEEILVPGCDMTMPPSPDGGHSFLLGKLKLYSRSQ